MRQRARRSRPGGDPAAGRCRGCGACCELYGDTLAAEASDLDRWRAQGRVDLLERVGENGALWLDPASGGHEPRCPFIVPGLLDAVLCAIHATKPDMCRAYPTDAQGHRCLRMPGGEEGDE